MRSDGERRVVAAALAPVKERDHVAMVVASLHDVTDERRAREAVSLSEARYRQLFDTAHDAVLTLSLTGAITSANPAACDVFDVPGDQLLGRSFHPLLAPGDVDRVTTFLRDARHGDARRWECTIVRPGGGTRSLAVTASPMQQGRAVIGLLLVARDLTDQRDRMDGLQRSEARYAQLVETAADAIFTVDEEGSFTSVNRAFEAATGHGRDAITGHHFTALLDPRDREAIWELFVSALHGQRMQREVRYLDASGRSRWGSLVASPIVERGRVVGVLGMVRDVSAEKRLVEELVRRERLASVGQLLDDGARALTDPVSAVLALSELLVEEPPGASSEREMRTMLRDEARRAADTLAHLRDVTGERPTQRGEVQLAALVGRAIAVRRFAMESNGVTLQATLPDDLPATVGDAGRLQEAVAHLLTRAEHALHEWGGERRIAVRLSRVVSDLVLEVQDSGAGIATSDLERMFTPGAAMREGGELAGLGLAVAAGIVREHGGRMHVDSTPGAGTTFVVELPITTPDAGAALAPRRAAPTDAPLDVLVLNDAPAMRQALAGMLHRLGHRVHIAADGASARALLDREAIDRLVLDVRLPRPEVEGLVGTLRQGRPALLPCSIVLTGDAAHSDVSPVLRDGGGVLLRKPFTLDDLRAALDASAPLVE
jgi:two-component system NtrC family sensor kinase